MIGEIKYAKSGTLNIAYQVIGDADESVVLIPGWVSNIEEAWNLPGLPDFIDALMRHHRVIMFDKRGTGLSDRVNEEDLPNLDIRIDDLRAIMENENIQRTSLIGVSEGGPMAILFTATFPERVKSLIIVGSYAHWLKSKNNPYGIPIEKHEKALALIDEFWAKGYGLKSFAPSWSGNLFYEKIWSSFLRKSASPNTAKALYRMNLKIDVRHLLPAITAPTLVIHRTGDALIPFGLGRQIATDIPRASLLTLDGNDHLFWIDPEDKIKRAIVEFLGHPMPDVWPGSAIYTMLLVNHHSLDAYQAIEATLACRDAERTVSNPSFLTLAFRSPNRALKAAIEIAQVLNNRTSILIHTGVAMLNGSEITGPARELLLEVQPWISEPGIWVSEMCHQFLSTQKYEWPRVKSFALKDSNYSFQWYLMATSTRTERIEEFKKFADTKLNINDIEALIKLKDHIDSHYLDNPGLNELSLLFALNHFKLKYGFKRLFGLPIKQYLIDLRLKFAHQLLQESALPIQQIARKVGYQQPGSFSKAYFKKYGVNPQTEKDLAVSR